MTRFKKSKLYNRSWGYHVGRSDWFAQNFRCLLRQPDVLV
nr:MAG TPA: hypothetical protein [Caudoviricetes sp.]